MDIYTGIITLGYSIIIFCCLVLFIVDPDHGKTWGKIGCGMIIFPIIILTVMIINIIISSPHD